jgi:hypothetical protein
MLKKVIKLLNCNKFMDNPPNNKEEGCINNEVNPESLVQLSDSPHYEIIIYLLDYSLLSYFTTFLLPIMYIPEGRLSAAWSFCTLLRILMPAML